MHRSTSWHGPTAVGVCLHAFATLDPKPTLDRVASFYSDLSVDRSTSVGHTITLKDANAVPPARKTCRLSQPELEECKRQVTALLVKGHIRQSCSPYGSPVLFVRRPQEVFECV